MSSCVALPFILQLTRVFGVYDNDCFPGSDLCGRASVGQTNIIKHYSSSLITFHCLVIEPGKAESSEFKVWAFFCQGEFRTSFLYARIFCKTFLVNLVLAFLISRE